MRKGKSLIGEKVISEVDGTDMGRVKDLVFDHDSNQVLALLMSEKDLFGLIDAQIIPWSQIAHIGPDAITVVSSNSRIKAGEDSRVKSIMNRNTALSGTRVYTTDGKDLGTLADTYINDQTGHIDGYEISGGFVSDTMTGKRFLPSDHDLTLGKDVALVEPIAAQVLEEQKTNEPGGLGATTQSIGEKVSGAYESAAASVSTAYDSTKEKLGDTYANIAQASVEKQKEFVIGKVAGRDVFLPETNELNQGASSESSGAIALGTTAETGAGSATVQDSIAQENLNPGAPDLDLSSSGEVVDKKLLVRQGETITADHAEWATTAGILAQLVASAVAGAAGESLAAGKEKVSGVVASGSTHAEGMGADLQQRAEQAAIGKTAAREVVAPDGSILVAEGQIVSQGILDQARVFGKEKEVVGVAGLGAASTATQNASQAAQNAGHTVGEAATNLWESAKQKVSELTQVAQDKKAEYDESSEQSKINHALGRPTTRVILDTNDNVILNTGDIITHAAVNTSREAGVLDVLLTSVHDGYPDISPEMLRVDGTGEAALSGQRETPRNDSAFSDPYIIPDSTDKAE